MLKDNYFYENVITIIQPDGTKVDIKRKPGESNHSQVFLRALEQIPDLLENYQPDIMVSGGYDLASFVAACGNIIFWPPNVNDNSIMIVSIPRMPGKEQREQTMTLMEELKDNEVYVSLCEFKKRNSSKIKTDTLSHSGSFLKAYGKISEYFSKVEMLDSMLDESESKEVDLSKYSTTQK